MKKSVLDTLYDKVLDENMLYTQKGTDMYCKICEKYRKSDSFDDETEIANDLAELVYYEHERAFKIGVKVAFSLFCEVNAV